MVVARPGPKTRRWFAALVLMAGFLCCGVALAQEGTVIVRDGEAWVSVVHAPDGITSGPGSAAQPSDWPYICIWFDGAFSEEIFLTSSPVPGQWYWLACRPRPQSGREPILDVTQYDPTQPIPGEPDLISSYEVREFAEDFVTPPVLPIAISPTAEQITGVPTWLWPDGPTDTVSASATAGGLTVVVEARYTGTRYDPGDGSPAFTCTSPREWTPGASDSDCTHTYLSEEVGRRITATSIWDFYWYDNAAQQTPVLYQTYLFPQVLDVDVIDLEAVITRSSR